MKKLDIVKSRAVCLLAENVNTDQIIPARFLKKIASSGWGDDLFADMKPPELFDLPDAHDRRILITGPNFGSGSSREHAVWALRDFGFLVLISTSFADIFKENSLKNGLLTITLEPGVHEQLVDAWKKAPQGELTVDLAAQRISFADLQIDFRVNSFSRTCLLEGIDELGYVLRHEAQIAAFENRSR